MMPYNTYHSITPWAHSRTQDPGLQDLFKDMGRRWSLNTGSLVVYIGSKDVFPTHSMLYFAITKKKKNVGENVKALSYRYGVSICSFIGSCNSLLAVETELGDEVIIGGTSAVIKGGSAPSVLPFNFSHMRTW